MKKLFLLNCLFLSIRFANATMYLVVVGQNPPDLTNLCLGDTLRFSGDSLNQNLYGTIAVIVVNQDSSFNYIGSITSYYNVATTCDHIIVLGDFLYEFVPNIIAQGTLIINCSTGISNVSEKLPPVRLYPNPATNQVI